MERAFYITKYRNLGFKDSTKLLLNNTLEKGKMGNLVILIGANNSGKSNVLEALESFKNFAYEDCDLTTLSYDPKDQKPQLSLCCRDNKTNINYSCNFTYGFTEPLYTLPNFSGKIKYEFADDLVNTVKVLSFISDYFRRSWGNYEWINKINALITSIQNVKKSNIDNVVDEILAVMKDYFKECKQNSYFKNAWDNVLNNYPNVSFVKEMEIKRKSRPMSAQIENEFIEKYGINLIPQIINYETEIITGDKLETTPDKLKKSDFFKTLFNAIGVDMETVMNTYKAFEAQCNKGVLLTLEKQINKSLKKLANDFNKLYFLDDEDDKYRFEISLESGAIFLALFRGEKDIVLDYQSLGFLWFFSLYFNLLCAKSLSAGDILIMDEPATNLHVQGQIELRKFLKEFAIKNDITIVLATHSPFLIDLNYLDEIRVVKNYDGEAIICNDFTAVDPNDPDSLKPIKNSLTISNHVLLDPDRPVVFVEGITDYNYLLAFKQILDIKEDIVFLPISGVGNIKDDNYKEKQLEISKQLIQIKKHNPILLVDSDQAGLSMQKVNQDSELNVIALNQIDPSFRDMESLFAEDDLKQFGIVKDNNKIIKKGMLSAVIKTFAKEYSCSKATKDNFKKLFDYLLNL